MVARSLLPLDWWRRIRSRVISRAVEFVLHAAAVVEWRSSRAARSRRELLGRVLRASPSTSRPQGAGLGARGQSGKAHVFDSSPDVTANWKALSPTAKPMAWPSRVTPRSWPRPPWSPVATPRPRSRARSRCSRARPASSATPEGLARQVAAAAAHVERSAPSSCPVLGGPRLIRRRLAGVTRPRPDCPSST